MNLGFPLLEPVAGPMRRFCLAKFFREGPPSMDAGLVFARVAAVTLAAISKPQ